MELEHCIVENLSWLRRHARRYYSNPFDAEDLVSDTIEKLLRSRERFDSRKDFRPWALVVMRNTFITLYNRRKCVPFSDYDREDLYISPLTAEQDLMMSRILSIVRDCARRSIAIECVILYAKGFNYSEISQILGIPIGTVMSRISNGRKMLRQALE